MTVLKLINDGTIEDICTYDDGTIDDGTIEDICTYDDGTIDDGTIEDICTYDDGTIEDIHMMMVQLMMVQLKIYVHMMRVLFLRKWRWRQYI